MSNQIQGLKRKVRRLRMMTSLRVDEPIGGEYHSVFKGQGIEFDEVREYAYGDDARDIDWNVTARMGRPYIKRYREERQLTLILMIDISASLDFGTRVRTKSETAAELGCLLAAAADHHHDKIGLILFSDRIDRFMPPARGRGVLPRILREILAVNNRKAKTDIGAALRFLRRTRKRRSVALLISDFLDQSYEREMAICSRHHDLIACRIGDNGEQALPKTGMMTTTDPESGEFRVLDTSDSDTRMRLRQWHAEHRRRLAAICRRHRIDMLELSNEQSVVDDLHDFLRRRKQLLSGRFTRQCHLT